MVLSGNSEVFAPDMEERHAHILGEEESRNELVKSTESRSFHHQFQLRNPGVIPETLLPNRLSRWFWCKGIYKTLRNCGSECTRSPFIRRMMQSDIWYKKINISQRKINWRTWRLEGCASSNHEAFSVGQAKVKVTQVMSDSLQPHGLYRGSPGQNTGVGSLSLLQGIFPIQGSNPGLPHCRWILYQLKHKGSNKTTELNTIR